jgi:acyl-CoA thioester hydrolase
VNDQPTQRPNRPVPQLADYPHRATDTIRFADLDPQGHVNNAVFATYFETGRVAMFRNPDLGIGVPDGTYVLVRAEIDFIRELRWPGTVEIGTALAEFGRTSFKVAQVIFNDNACCASGRFTMVLADKNTRRPRPLTEDVLARLSQWKYKGQ